MPLLEVDNLHVEFGAFKAVDGVSLTVGDVRGPRFRVHLIPETLRATRFGAIAVGDAVNVAVDSTTQAVVDAVERVVDARVAAALAARAGT